MLLVKRSIVSSLAIYIMKSSHRSPFKTKQLAIGQCCKLPWGNIYEFLWPISICCKIWVGKYFSNSAWPSWIHCEICVGRYFLICLSWIGRKIVWIPIEMTAFWFSKIHQTTGNVTAKQTKNYSGYDIKGR